MFVLIWRFRALAGKAAEFRDAYGPGGAWALFGRGAGYLGTELFESATDAATYLTVDRWESAEAWQEFLQAWPEDYAARRDVRAVDRDGSRDRRVSDRRFLEARC